MVTGAVMTSGSAQLWAPGIITYAADSFRYPL